MNLHMDAMVQLHGNTETPEAQRHLPPCITIEAARTTELQETANNPF